MTGIGDSVPFDEVCTHCAGWVGKEHLIEGLCRTCFEKPKEQRKAEARAIGQAMANRIDSMIMDELDVSKKIDNILEDFKKENEL